MTHDRIITEYTADTRNFRRGARVYDQTLLAQQRLTNQRLDRIDARWERSSRNILQSRTSIAALSAVMSGAALVQVRSYGEEWRNVERRLQSIGETSKEAKDGLIDLAVRTRSAVGGTAAAVQRMAKSTGGDLETTTRRVETLQKLLAAGGATGSERASVSLQLGQALQSGVLSGDEFRSIRENAPVEFLDALASAAGITRGKLKEFAEDQKLTTEIVLRALDGLASTADQKFSAMAVSGEEAFSVLRTGLVSYVGQVDESLGATASFNKAMVHLGEYMTGAGEGADTMARAIQVAGAVALGTAGGRGQGALTQSLRAQAAARASNVAAAEKERIAARQAVIDAQAEVAASQAKRRARQNEYQTRVFNDQKSVQAKNRLTVAIREQTLAEQRLIVAQTRATSASRALAVAQQNLSLKTRVTTATMRAFNGVMAFFGGPIGLAITAASLFAAVLATSKTSAEKLEGSLSKLQSTMSAMETVNRALSSDYANLEAAQKQLAAATEQGGQAAVDAAALEVGAINSRILANEKLREELALTARAELNAAQEILDAQRLQLERGARESMLGDFWERVRGGPDAGFIERNFSSPNTEEWEEYARIQNATTEEIYAYMDAERERARLALESGATLDDLTDYQQELLTSTNEAALQVAIQSDKLDVLQTAAITAADGLDVASSAADNLAASAAAASDGIAGLIAQIPALHRAAQMQTRLAKANEDYRAAVSDLNSQGLSATDRMEAEEHLASLHQRAIAEIDGTRQSADDARAALDKYTDRAYLESLDARTRAVTEESRAYKGLRDQLIANGATEADLAAAEAAHATKLASIEDRYKERGSGGGGGRSRKSAGGSTADRTRDEAAARELLVEAGHKQLFVEQSLNAERAKLQDLLPTLISMGLSQADAQNVLNSELERTEENLRNVKSESEKTAESFARGVMSDIRHANSLGDAIDRVSDRLFDLALSPVFDWLANSFASMVSGGGGDGGFLGTLFGALFNANGNAFAASGVVPFARGGVFDRPTGFQFGNGRLGVMGEAGPEAVMPLRRGSDGKLGVVAAMPTLPTGPSPHSVNASSSFEWSGDMVINSQNDQPQEVGREVSDQMRAMFQMMFDKQLMDAMRAGGTLDNRFAPRGGR